MRKLIIVIILFLSGLVSFSQPNITDVKLAFEYFRNKEYEKAIIIYKNLYETTNSRTYLYYYINCLMELSEYENAEKLIRQLLKKSPEEISFKVDLGYIYKREGKTEKSKETFDDVVDELPSDINQIQKIANTFREKGENEYAEKVYVKARNLLRNQTLFRNDLSNVYMAERKYEEMIDEILYMIDDDQNNLINAQNRLQSIIFNDIEDNIKTIVKSRIIKHVQIQPDNNSFSELLVWLYIQDKEFSKAFTLAKAIDKRSNENGERLISLARLAVSNNSFDEAEVIYQYVIEKGNTQKYYFTAKKELLSTSFSKLAQNRDFNKNEYIQLENNYLSLLEEFGSNYQTAEAIKELAHIQAFYLEKEEPAIELLENSIKINGISQNDLSEIKLELADILLFTGNVWDAALTYGQVEKANENNPIGHEAKFRKAKLAYFSGDFKWSQAQLDVLKASTSKLIANDAAELSLLISDNSELDTTEQALRMFSRADLLDYQNKDSLSLLTLDSLLREFPSHSLMDDAYFKKATIYYKHQKYNEAAENYKIIVDHYGYDLLGDDALFDLAVLFETKLNDQQKAMDLYKELMTNYPSSIYVIEARKHFRKLRGDEI